MPVPFVRKNPQYSILLHCTLVAAANVIGRAAISLPPLPSVGRLRPVAMATERLLDPSMGLVSSSWDRNVSLGQASSSSSSSAPRTRGVHDSSEDERDPRWRTLTRGSIRTNEFAVSFPF